MSPSSFLSVFIALPTHPQSSQCLCLSVDSHECVEPSSLSLSPLYYCLYICFLYLRSLSYLWVFLYVPAHVNVLPHLSFPPLGWLLPSAFSTCECFVGSGASKAAPKYAPSRWRRAATARCHHCGLCPAGDLHCAGGSLWACAAPGPGYSPHRATSPKTRKWHLPHPLATAKPTG